MKTTFAALAPAVALIMASSSLRQNKQKLTVDTSMKESLIGKLGEAFKKNPDIEFDYYTRPGPVR